MFSPDFQKYLVCSVKPHGEFKERFVRALSKRIQPRGPIHANQLAGHIGMHGETVRIWLRGEGGISSEAVDAVIAYFVWMRDPTFLIEVYPQVEPLVQAKHEAERAHALVRGLKQFLTEDAVA